MPLEPILPSCRRLQAFGFQTQQGHVNLFGQINKSMCLIFYDWLVVEQAIREGLAMCQLFKWDFT
jgi:hypothetical protein